MCATCVPGVHGSQRRASDPLVLELPMFVGCHIGSKNQTTVFSKSSS